MKRIILAGLMAAAVGPKMALAQPSQFYINPAFNVVNSAFQIDAINFVNYGTFRFAGISYIPFETFDTLNYTNFGTIRTSPGWRFDLSSTSTGMRSWSASFANFNLGVVESDDVDNLGTSALGNPCVIARVDPSYLLISATNIVTQAGVPAAGASLSVGPNGGMVLQGDKVDASRSGLEVVPVWVESVNLGTGNVFVNNPPTAFIPDIAVFDQIWAQASYNQNYGLNQAGLWNGVTASALAIPAPPSAPAAFPGFSIFASVADSFVNSQFQTVVLTNFMTITNTFTDPTNHCSTNVVGVQEVDVPITVRSNVIKGAAFVGLPPGFNAQIGFSGSTQPLNPFQTVSILISTTISNAVTGLQEPATIEIQDRLASDTTLRGVIPNQVGCGAVTDRPLPYTVDRQPTLLGGPGNNGLPDATFFTSSSSQPLATTNIIRDAVTNPVVIVGDFAGYRALFDNQVSRPPAVPGGAISNDVGRIQISANVLDLTKARIRGEGALFIDTPHLVSSSQAVIDCESLSFNLGSTNGNLRIQNFSPPTGQVQRFRGPISVWSTVWSNTVSVIVATNYILTNTPVLSPCDTNNPPATIGTNTTVIGRTNIAVTVGVLYQVTMVDATGLTTVVPVTVYDLVTHSRNVVMDDNMSVVQSLLIDGQSFTLNGSLRIPGAFPVNPITGLAPATLPLFDFRSSNAPNVLFFTNDGIINVNREAHFGDDRILPYSVFVNTGTVSAASLTVDSTLFENGGALSATFGLTLEGGVGILDGGSSTSGGSSQFMFNTLKFNNYSLASSDALTFRVGGSLSDAGAGSANTFQVQNGFNLLTKPQAGDLLGSTFQSMAPAVPSVQINHKWAAEDRGPTPAGFVDNTSLGVLALTSQSPDPLFDFAGTGTQNGLYVDLLDLSALSDYTNQIRIEPNLVIYFAAARLNFTPPADTNGIAQEPEEFLDGQFGGHLRWVQGFAGPNSSTAVIVNGQSVQVNTALRNSQRIDSNGSTPNFVTAEPFTAGGVSVGINGNGTVVPDYDGQSLLVGLPYAMEAQAADGFVFVGWSGDAETNSPLLTFVMPGSLSVVANFAFVLSPGSYSGLFFETNGAEVQRSGAFILTTTKNGKYTGSVQLSNKKFGFTGQLDASGVISMTVPNSSLALNAQVGNDHVTGSIGDTGGAWIAGLLANRTPFNVRTNPAPFPAKSTLVIPGTPDLTNNMVPQGNGFASVAVNAAGKVQVSGILGDGTKFTDTSAVSVDGQWALFVPLYNGQGQLLGWQAFATNGTGNLLGSISWIKPTNNAKLYPNGFDVETNSFGVPYNPTNKPITGFQSARVILFGGDLGENGITNAITIGANNKVSNAGPNKLTMTLNPALGFFKGSIVNPATGKSVKYNGAILQGLGMGIGNFLGPDQSGPVIVAP